MKPQKPQLKQQHSVTARDAELSAQFSKVSVSGLPALQNRAGDSTSPYVQSHASTPVAWQLLDDEAIQRARKENKLIFMNIGFKSCHCRFLNPRHEGQRGRDSLTDLERPPRLPTDHPGVVLSPGDRQAPQQLFRANHCRP